MRVCAVIPVFRHYQRLPAVIAALRAYDLPVIVVDDGNAEPARSAIQALAAPADGVTVCRFDHNRGKGAAVIAGIRRAATDGFTHVLQVDADGQHDLTAVPAFLDQARTHPEALVTGAAVFDDSVPLGRRLGRWLTHVWVYVETLSFAVSDSMCGFRIYPLAVTLPLLAEEPIGGRMDFDTDVLVRLVWRGVQPVMLPVRVTYPAGNVSNFDMLRDNWRITCMHTRLVFAMVGRLPSVVAHRPRPAASPAAHRRLSEGSHWAQLAERGSYWGLRFLAAAYRLLGRRGCLVVLSPIVFYFYATDGARRRWSRIYLARAFAAAGMGRTPGAFDVYRHFHSFAARAVDVFAAWIGAVRPAAVAIDDPAAVQQLAADTRGAVLVVSHHGNAELSRAVLDQDVRRRITVLAHTRHAENYNRLLREFRPEAAARIIQVTEIGPETAVELKERVQRGEWIAIAGDRSPVLSHDRVVRIPFLGTPAPFPQGPWLLAFLLECPVYVLLCWRESKGWRLSLNRIAERVDLPRAERIEAMVRTGRGYVAQLEKACREHPFQWFNFFDFWAES